MSGLKLFKPGDRVVYMSWGSPHQAVAGTVVGVDWITTTPDGEWISIRVILDTAHEVADNAHEWIYEEYYLRGDFIPF